MRIQKKKGRTANDMEIYIQGKFIYFHTFFMFCGVVCLFGFVCVVFKGKLHTVQKLLASRLYL